MTINTDPKDDRRSVDGLFLAALMETDPDLAWNAIAALHWRGTREVLERAIALCRSDCSFERRVGADVLGQLGVPDRAFSNECTKVFIDMLNSETNDEALESVLVAISFHSNEDVIGPVLRYSNHPDPDIRHAVVLALTGYENPAAINKLIDLTNDAIADVRDWATFALGTQTELDTPEVRQALLARLEDDDEETRNEAIIGLARRKDERIIPVLMAEFEKEYVSASALEAAQLSGFPELHSYLISLQGKLEGCTDLLEKAVLACDPNQK